MNGIRLLNCKQFVLTAISNDIIASTNPKIINFKVIPFIRAT